VVRRGHAGVLRERGAGFVAAAFRQIEPGHRRERLRFEPLLAGVRVEPHDRHGPLGHRRSKLAPATRIDT
jgi:hypothetical protein